MLESVNIRLATASEDFKRLMSILLYEFQHLRNECEEYENDPQELHYMKEIYRKFKLTKQYLDSIDRMLFQTHSSRANEREMFEMYEKYASEMGLEAYYVVTRTRGILKMAEDIIWNYEKMNNVKLD